jgi:hypothetical protein
MLHSDKSSYFEHNIFAQTRAALIPTAATFEFKAIKKQAQLHAVHPRGRRLVLRPGKSVALDALCSDPKTQAIPVKALPAPSVDGLAIGAALLSGVVDICVSAPASPESGPRNCLRHSAQLWLPADHFLVKTRSRICHFYQISVLNLLFPRRST